MAFVEPTLAKLTLIEPLQARIISIEQFLTELSFFLSMGLKKACRTHVNLKPCLYQYWVVIHIHTFSFVQVERILDLGKPGSNIMLPSQNFSLVTKNKTSEL